MCRKSQSHPQIQVLRWQYLYSTQDYYHNFWSLLTALNSSVRLFDMRSACSYNKNNHNLNHPLDYCKISTKQFYKLNENIMTLAVSCRSLV